MGVGVDGVGVSNGEKGGTTVTEQQYIFKKFQKEFFSDICIQERIENFRMLYELLDIEFLS